MNIRKTKIIFLILSLIIFLVLLIYSYFKYTKNELNNIEKFLSSNQDVINNQSPKNNFKEINSNNKKNNIQVENSTESSKLNTLNFNTKSFCKNNNPKIHTLNNLEVNNFTNKETMPSSDNLFINDFIVAEDGSLIKEKTSFIKSIESDGFVVKGIRNVGNKCFLIANIQVLFACTRFRNYLNNHKFEENQPVNKALKSFLNTYNNSTGTVALKELTDNLSKIELLKPYKLDDINAGYMEALSFFSTLIYCLNEETKLTQNNEINELFFNNFTITSNSPCKCSIKMKIRYEDSILLTQDVDISIQEFLNENFKPKKKIIYDIYNRPMCKNCEMEYNESTVDYINIPKIICIQKPCYNNIPGEQYKYFSEIPTFVIVNNKRYEFNSTLINRSDFNCSHFFSMVKNDNYLYVANDSSVNGKRDIGTKINDSGIVFILYSLVEEDEIPNYT